MRSTFATKLLLLLLVAAAFVPAVDGYCSASTTPQGAYSATGGTIMTDSDGNGGSYYVDNEYCEWTLTCSNGDVVTVEQSGYVEGGWDYVNLRDGGSGGSSLYYSSGGISGTFTTTTSTLFIQFTTDYSVVYNGVSWVWYCGPPTPAPPTPAPTPAPMLASGCRGFSPSPKPIARRIA